MPIKTLRVALLDMYAGEVNQGMRCIREILRAYSDQQDMELTCDEFEVRKAEQLPGLAYDVYLSTGGPGSPLDSGEPWEEKYFAWLRSVVVHNQQAGTQKKYVLFICHSFQLACRYFGIGEVSKRKSTSFGVFPVHLAGEGRQEQVFDGLRDPFYAVDSREYQVVGPDDRQLESIGASVLAIEKERPHVPLERAIMAVRFNDYMLGTQFHPEADAVGMTMYLQRDDKKKTVIDNHGEEKWQSMIDQLNDPDKIRMTYSQVIPNFLQQAATHEKEP